LGAVAARPELRRLGLADPAGRWEALGFAVHADIMCLGGASLQLGLPGDGIVGWAVSGLIGDIDGLPSLLSPHRPAGALPHPNGAIGLDHVVVITPDFDRTAAALEQEGLALRRTRETPGGIRQGFRRLGPAILELVQAPAQTEPGPARFWGLVVIVEDLQALAERLGERLGPIHPAVQPGRRIATLRASAGLGQAVAFMDPAS